MRQRKPFSFVWSILGLSLLWLSACSDPAAYSLKPRQLGWKPAEDISYLMRTDSMIGELAGLNNRDQLDSLLEWTDRMNYVDRTVALDYANEAHSLAEQMGDRLAQAISMYYRALIKSRGQILGEGIKDALTDAQICNRNALPSDPETWLVRFKNIMGYLYFRNYASETNREAHYLDSAIYYTSFALTLSETAVGRIGEQERQYLQAQLYQDLATIYSGTDSLKTLENYQQGIAAAEKSANLSQQAAIWRGLGAYFMNRSNLDLADSALINSKQYALEALDTLNIVNTYQRLGDLRGRQYNESGNEALFAEGMQYLEACLPLQKDNLFYTYEIIAYNFDDKFYYLNGNPARQYSAEADSAIVYYNRALEEAKKEGAVDLMAFTISNLSGMCANKENLTDDDCTSLLDGETPTNLLSTSYRDIIKIRDKEQAVSNKKIRDFEKAQEKEKSEQTIFITRLITLGSLLLLGLIFLILLQRQQKKRLEARMEALRAQINPHFISNSLNAIENLVNMGKREDASKYLIHFSRLTRRILNSSRSPMTTLKDELNTLKHFLELEKLRFRNKLDYRIQLEPGLPADSINVPALILQPYIENAILHGIKPKAGVGSLLVDVRQSRDKLRMVIEDDGIGREKSAALKAKSALPKSRRSHGMKITEERIKIANKAKGTRVQIEDLYDRDGEAAGTRVILTLPMNLKKK